MNLVNANAAEIIEEKNLNKDVLIKSIDNLIVDTKKVKKFNNNLSKLQISDSLDRIYREIEKLVNNK